MISVSLMFDAEGGLREIRASQPVAIETVDVVVPAGPLGAELVKAAMRLAEAVGDHVGLGPVVWTDDAGPRFPAHRDEPEPPSPDDGPEPDWHKEIIL